MTALRLALNGSCACQQRRSLRAADGSRWGDFRQRTRSRRGCMIAAPGVRPAIPESRAEIAGERREPTVFMMALFFRNSLIILTSRFCSKIRRMDIANRRLTLKLDLIRAGPEAAFGRRPVIGNRGREGVERGGELDSKPSSSGLKSLSCANLSLRFGTRLFVISTVFIC